jgi:hypothetical protein
MYTPVPWPHYLLGTGVSAADEECYAALPNNIQGHWNHKKEKWGNSLGAQDGTGQLKDRCYTPSIANMRGFKVARICKIGSMREVG